MNTEQVIKELLLTGLTPKDIFDLARTTQQKADEGRKYRQNVLDAIFDYVRYLIPDIEITEEDKENLSEYMKEFEKNLEKFMQKPTPDNKSKEEEDAIKRFLIRLGC